MAMRIPGDGLGSRNRGYPVAVLPTDGDWFQVLIIEVWEVGFPLEMVVMQPGGMKRRVTTPVLFIRELGDQ